MQRALAARRGAERRRAWFVRAGAMAAAAGLLFTGYRFAFVQRPAHGGAGAAPRSVEVLADTAGATAKPLGAGSRVVADRDRAVGLHLSTGTELVVEQGGDLTVLTEPATQRFRLDDGVLRARVARLGTGERFIVQTPDSEVEVHGTSFVVTVVPPDRACAGTRTQVSVATGQVAVRTGRGAVVLGPGGAWPAGCPLVAVKASSPEVEPGSASPRAAPSAPSLSRGGAPAAPSPSSNLAEVNDLFAEAMAAKHAGQSARALDLLSKIVTRHPSSPLAESALVEQIRLTKETDPTRASQLVARYLERYPRGFARAEIEAIASGHP
jgi:hypothetical protein